MTYRPREEVYGPPLVQRLPALFYTLVAAALVVTVVIVERGPHDGWLYEYMFMQKHLIDTRTLAGVVVVSALASLVRSGMRGVRIRGDAVEYRDVISSVWPRVKRFRWAQIDAISLEPGGSIALELWDGSCQFLPAVADPEGLAAALERVALARAIPLRGGRGLDDLPESVDFPQSEEA
jgi:hypothetical protein